MSKIRVLHAYYTRDFTYSKRRQMEAERASAAHIGAVWDLLVYSKNKPKTAPSYLRYQSSPSRLGSLLHLFRFHLKVNALAKKYDLILKRHNKLDIFQPIFSLLQPNIIPMHHAKEDMEILLNDSSLWGRVKARIECYLTIICTIRVKFVAGVTPEISAYHSLRSLNNKPWVSLPNGYDPNSFPLIADKRTGIPKIIFVATLFKPWHGLDRLLNAAVASNSDFILYVVGEVDEVILKAYSQDCRIVFYGYLEGLVYRPILAEADVAIGSLQFHLTGLNESCTLKNTDYLLSGLCVYAGDTDCRLPSDFPYYVVGQPDIESICSFAIRMRSFPRLKIREAALPYVSKISHLKSFLNQAEKF